MADIKFPEGISVFAKSANAPDFVGDSIVIDTPKLIAWLQSQPMKVRLQIATSKQGKKYLKVDDWQPGAGQQPSQANIDKAHVAYRKEITTETPDNNDLPF